MMIPMHPDHPSRPLREPQPPVGYGGGGGGGGAPLIESMTVHERPRLTRRGNPIVSPDPGTPTSRLLAVLAAVLLAGIVIVWQNIGEDRQQRLIQAPPTPPPAAQAADEAAPGGMTDFMARAFLRMRGVMAGQDRESIVRQVESTAANDADLVRVIIMAAEYLGHDEATERIMRLRGDLSARDQAAHDADAPPESEEANRRLIRAELDALETIYSAGPDALDQPARDRLSARYGVLGDFALTVGKPEAERDAVIGGPWPLLIFFGLVFALGAVAALAGFVLLIVGMIWYFSPRTVMRCEKPVPGGSVLLETYALFVAGFAVLSIGSAVVAAHAPESVRDLVEVLHLPAQWLLMLTVLWPLARGMAVPDWRRALGLTRGRGVAREMGCGLLVYIASIPLYLAGVLVSVLLMTAWNYVKTRFDLGEPAPPPENPIIELVGSGDIVVLILIFTLATLWAPITEELIFRGALFRHLRARLHWTVAALASAVLFAYMHSYGPLMVAPLIALGFMFAFMREWRGSIIAPMTAHFLHNFTLMTVMILAFRIIG